MSAVRKDSPTPPPAAPAPPSALECAKRFLSPEQFAKLESIVTLRELPSGRADWSIVADSTGLLGDKRNPLAGLQPYLWLLAAILHVSQRLSWAEIGQHPWIFGGIPQSTIYNKRGKAQLVIGISFEQFVAEYRQAYERAQAELIAYHAQIDAEEAQKAYRLSRGIGVKLLEQISADIDVAQELRDSFEFREPSEREQDPGKPQQAPLELLDTDGRPMEPREAATESARRVRISRRLELTEQFTRATRHATAVIDTANKGLRLTHGQSTENVAEVEADPALTVDFDLDRAREEIERLEAEEAQLNARLAQLAAEDSEASESGEDA